MQGLKKAASAAGARSTRITVNNLLDVPLRRAECSIMCEQQQQHACARAHTHARAPARTHTDARADTHTHASLDQRQCICV